MEAARLWARRAMFSIPRSAYRSHPISAARLITARNCWFSFSTANYQPAAQAAAETTNQPGTGTEHHRASKHNSLTHDVPPGSSATSYGADTAKKGVKKADTAKETVDGAPKVAKKGVKEAVTTDDGAVRIEEDATVNEMKKVEQPVDTYEYRSIEELREKAGGYDLADDNKT